MRVLVTGISGFIGNRLARHLLACGDEVHGTWIGVPPNQPGVDLRELDLADRDHLARLIDEVDPEAIVHLAALSHVGASWDRMAEYFQVNVLGSENLLDVAGDRPVVLASSAEVYGAVPDAEQPISEDRPPAPASPYAMTKAAAERLVVGRGATVVRFFNLVGPGQLPTFALPSFATQLAGIAAGGGKGMIEVGNLGARRDFTHVDDAVEGVRLLLTDGAPGTIYNLGTGEAVSIADALDLLVEISGVEAEVRIDSARFRPVDLPLLLADATRLRSLGWSPQRTFRQALTDLWESTTHRG